MTHHNSRYPRYPSRVGVGLGTLNSHDHTKTSHRLPRASGGGGMRSMTEGVLLHALHSEEEDEEKTPSVSLRSTPPPEARGRRLEIQDTQDTQDRGFSLSILNSLRRLLLAHPLARPSLGRQQRVGIFVLRGAHGLIDHLARFHAVRPHRAPIHLRGSRHVLVGGSS